MGLTIWFKVGKIFKRMKTGRFWTFCKGSNFKCQERYKVKFCNTLKWINRVYNFPAWDAIKKCLCRHRIRKDYFLSFLRDLLWQNGHTWMSKLMFYLVTISARAFIQIWMFEYITTVGVDEALSFLSTFILYLVYCFPTDKCVLKPKLWQGFLILFF